MRDLHHRDTSTGTSLDASGTELGDEIGFVPLVHDLTVDLNVWDTNWIGELLIEICSSRRFQGIRLITAKACIDLAEVRALRRGTSLRLGLGCTRCGIHSGQAMNIGIDGFLCA